MYTHGQPLQHNQLHSAKVVFQTTPLPFLYNSHENGYLYPDIQYLSLFTPRRHLLLYCTNVWLHSSFKQSSPQLSHSFYFTNFERAASFGPSFVALYHIGPCHYRNRVTSHRET